MAMTRSDIGPGRLEAFSDGVIAIIVTIMVLELKLPEHVADKGLLNGLLVPMSPKLASYAMSFLVVAIMWVNHHALMATVRHATRAILWQNNHLLFWMSLIPFATNFLGENPGLADAYAVYGFVLAASAAAFASLRWLASTQGSGRSGPCPGSSHCPQQKPTWYLLVRPVRSTRLPIDLCSDRDFHRGPCDVFPADFCTAGRSSI